MKATDEDPDSQVEIAMETTSAIRPLLAGKGAAIQGAILLELVAAWLAGHDPRIRATVLKQWGEHVIQMIPLAEKEMFEHHERPEGWGG